MRYLKTISFKKISIIALSAIMVFANPTGGSAQDWPDPLVELVSINADTSSYFNDGKIKFNLSINRINGSAYSDITRVWICPKANWDGFLCNTGQFLVSTTPNSVDTNFVIESPPLTLSDGEYLITGVSFRNGAVISGFTLMYPRSGVVTIGGIATNIALANLAAADFILTTPVPEPEPTPEPTPEPEPVSEPETTTEPKNEPATETQPDNQSETTTEAADESSGTGEANTETETNTDAEANTEPETNSAAATENNDAAQAETQTTEPVTDGANENTEAENATTDTTSPESVTEADQDNAVSDNENSAAAASVNQPSVTQVVSGPAAAVQPVITVVVDQPADVKTTQSDAETTEIKTLTPDVAAALTTATAATITDTTVPAAVTESVFTKKQLPLPAAIGGKVLKVTGAGKLTRKVSGGSGSLKLLATNNSQLKIKLGSRLISSVELSSDQVIRWQRNQAGILKLILSGQSPELLIDALQINGRLVANPAFQMRS